MENGSKTYSIFSRLIDLIAPRACVVCGSRLSVSEQVMCAVCNLHLPRTHYAGNAYDNEMAKRFWGQMSVEKAAALFFYESKSEATLVIRQLKYHGHPEYGIVLGRQTAQEFMPQHFFDGIDALVPVPLAANRLRQRGYNQSMEIAKGIREITRLPIIKDAVTRKTFKESQTQKSRAERSENVAHAFELSPKADIRGKHLLLIDDVVTTGATAIACGKELLKAQDVKLSVLSIGFTKGA